MWHRDQLLLFWQLHIWVERLSAELECIQLMCPKFFDTVEMRNGIWQNTAQLSPIVSKCTWKKIKWQRK